MATIKKISGVGDAGTLTTNHRLLVEAPNGTLGSTTVGAVNNHTHTWSSITDKPSTFTPASHTQGEATLTWGGGNFSGSYGPVDASMIPELGANRLAFGNPSGITIEYSRNGGSTWTDYGADNNSKVNLFSPPGEGFSIGKADSNNKATADYLLRVTINTGSFGVYTALNKFMIYCSTNGSTGTYCSIDAALESTPTTFVNFANKVPISGWSGYNIINTSSIITYGNSSSSQYGRLRFTFGCTGGSTSYSGLVISKIYGFGGVGWSAPSHLARTGHIYSIGSGQSVAFPGSVSASGGFSGSLTGDVTGNVKGNVTGNVTGNVSGSSGSCTGNAASSSSIAASSQLTSATAVDEFLEANKLKYATFTNYSAIGFGSNDGLIVSIPWSSSSYGFQLAFDDATTGLIKVRGKSSTWGDWKQLWKEGDAVTGAVWNDLIDCLDVPEDDILEPGYCYCMHEDGHYRKSEKYLDSRYIGIDSDTYSLAMGMEKDKRKLNAAVAGFVLAYVDKEYPTGTALTCTENGVLTEIKREDKCYNPEMIIAKYWKNEEREEIVREDKTVKVNGRKWVKVV